MVSLVPEGQVFADDIFEVLAHLLAGAHLQARDGDFARLRSADGADYLLDLRDQARTQAQPLEPQADQQRGGQRISGHLPANTHRRAGPTAAVADHFSQPQDRRVVWLIEPGDLAGAAIDGQRVQG